MTLPQFLFLAAIAVTYCSCEVIETRDSNFHKKSRQTMINRIIGYLPVHDVTDIANLDLDQNMMEQLVLTRELNHARLLYEEGGHSMSYAAMHVVDAPTNVEFPAGSTVWGVNDVGQKVVGNLLEDLIFDSSSKQGGNVTVRVVYDDEQVLQPFCRVGALHYFNAGYLNNCFTKNSSIQIFDSSNKSTSLNYTYNIHTENVNALSLRKVATAAADLFQGLPSFEIFKTFYGESDYADRWAMAAANSGSTGFRSGLGNADFQLLQGRFGHGEGLIKGSAVLNVNMYSIGKLEMSVNSCKASNFSDASFHLDEAVALYAGSLAGSSDSGEYGLFMYGLANNRAINFKTAGHSGDKDIGTAWVNVFNLDQFKRMQANYLSKNASQCVDAANTCALIVNKMKVPLVQSVLAYAYIRDRAVINDTEEIEKNTGKGATYTAAILPYIHSCSPKDAATIYDFMRVGSDTNQLNFVAVKQALERTYPCLGITCSDVGGIWDGMQYSADAEPCGLSSPSSSGQKQGNKFGKAFGITFSAILCLYFVIRYRKKLSLRRRGKTSDFSSGGTIAAVSEIS